MSSLNDSTLSTQNLSHELKYSFDNFNNIFFTSSFKHIIWLMSLCSYHSPLLHWNILLIISTIFSSHLHSSILYDWCLFVHIILHFFKRIRPRIYLWNFAAKNKLWKYKGPHNTLSRVYTQGIYGHSFYTHLHKWSFHSNLSKF